ncbi:MAG TPA: GNVR domain-containing protein [Vicinamibacterales bacterium]|nr:GNVR domain-containing protein [Vicinamibacterales bacterium]
MAREFMSPASDESIALRTIAILRRRALIAAVAFTTVIAAAVAFAVYLPDLYTASAIVTIERPLPDGVIRTNVGNELESRLYQIRQEVLSRERLTSLIKRFDLYPELRRTAGFEDVLNQAREDIDWEANGPEQVSGRTKTVAFTLTYTGNDQRNVANVTNAIAQFFVEHNSAIRAGEARRAVQLVEEQMKAAKQQVDIQEARLRDFTLRNQAQLPQAAGVAMAAYQSLADELRRNRDDQRRNMDAREKLLEGLEDASAVAAAAKGVLASDPAGVPVSKELAEARERLGQARKDLIEAERKGFTANHPEIISASSRIAAIEKEVQDQQARDLAAYKARQATDAQRQAVSNTPQNLAALPRSRRGIKDFDDELTRLRSEEKDLQQRIAVLQQRFDSTPGVQEGYLQAQREYSSAKENYDVLARRFDEARLAESVETGHQGENFRILDAAVAPEGPSAPNRLRLVLMGLLLALAAMAGAVVLAEQFDTSFHNVDEVREFTGVPVLATIPQIGAAPRRGWARATLGTASAVAAVVLVATLSAYLAHGNDTLVRLLQRAG